MERECSIKGDMQKKKKRKKARQRKKDSLEK